MTGNKGLTVCPGNPVIMGANRVPEGMNFALEAPAGAEISLVLYKKGFEEPFCEIPFESERRSGKIWSMLLTGLDESRFEYNFRVDGRIVQDPDAYGLAGREHFGIPAENGREHGIRCTFLSGQDYDWQGDISPAIPYDRMILYKLHVRGYTKQAKIARRLKGTFSGLAEMIPYWKKLGINAVELMPAYEFMEVPVSAPDSGQSELIREKKETDRINYWGYTDGFYFAPKRSYCATKNPENEVRDLIRLLHASGIECILEMYFPAGTPPFRALTALWFWKRFYHVDGFHLTGDGVPVQLIREDALLYGTKRMFGEIKRSTEPDEMLAEYNPGFLQDMRRFLKSDEGMAASAEYHIRRNAGGFGTVNYMACQDGFTLNDMVSYNYRHNEENRENNRDGSDFNYSWNCGEEGPSRKKAVKCRRGRQMRNAFMMLLLSQGTPMIYAGDEFGNSQEGNNNAWCQDNLSGWTDWKAFQKNEKLASFVREAIAFRRAHPILHMPGELRGVDYLAKGFPDISFHGERAWYLNTDNTSRLLGVMYCGLYAEKADGTPDDFIYTGYNFHWESRRLALPNLPGGMVWHKWADTAEEGTAGWFYERPETYSQSVEISPRSVVVLVAVRGEKETV